MKFESAIIILAPPSKVHAVLCDMAKYPEWNPLIRAVTGAPRPWTPELNGPLTVWVDNPVPLMPRLPLPVTVTALTPIVDGVEDPKGYEITWKGTAPLSSSILSATHAHKSIPDPTNPGRTNFVHSEVWEGIAPLPFSIAGNVVPTWMTLQPRFDDFAKALKKRVESIHS